MKLIKINGKLYREMLMSNGTTYCAELFDVNNEVAFSGVIWNNQPFEYVENFLLKTLIYVVNYFKKDCFGNSQFLKEI